MSSLPVVVLVLIFPVFGILAYLILRGGGMAARAARSQQEARDRFDSYVKSALCWVTKPIAISTATV